MAIDTTSSGWRLFKQIFHCRVKSKHLIDEQHAREYGYPTTGDDDFDRQLAEEWRDVYLPASDIAELIDDGADVLLVEHKDSITLYDLVVEHLEWWDNKFRTTLHIDPERLVRVRRDLDVLSRLGDAIYPIVRTYVTKSHKHLTDRVEGVMPFRPTEQVYTLDDTDVGQWEAPTIPSHRRLEDIIDTSTLKRVRVWEKST